MEKASQRTGSSRAFSFSPSPPVSAPDPSGKPEQSAGMRNLSMMSRPEFGKNGQRIQLLTNYFKVSVQRSDVTFYQYIVSICSGGRKSAEENGRAVVDKLFQTYPSLLDGEEYAYDGRKFLYPKCC